MELLHAIMCGGAGRRLWPLSRRSRPKPFLSLFGGRSLLQATVDRMGGFPGSVTTIAIGAAEHRFLIAEHLRDTSGAAEVVLEPSSHDTAPVALVAALRAQALFGGDGLVLLVPADHVIPDSAALHAAIEQAAPAANAGFLVTFGAAPTGPETGYGYIETADRIGIAGVRVVRHFHEKPDRDTARAYCDSGRHLWNTGIFLFAPKMMIAAAASLHPEMLRACRLACDRARHDADFVRLDEAAYRDLETISFDYAFAETLGSKVGVVPVDMGWSDIGSWRGLTAIREADGFTAGPAQLVDCFGTLAMSDGPLVIAHGLNHTVVVAAGDAVYVAPLARADEIKDILKRLGAPASDL